MRLRFLLFLFIHHLFLSLLLIFDHKLLRQGLKDVRLVDLRYFREVAEFFDIFNFSLKEFIQSAEIEEASGLPKEEGCLNCVYTIEHGVIVDGQLFEDAN